MYRIPTTPRGYDNLKKVLKFQRVKENILDVIVNIGLVLLFVETWLLVMVLF